MGYIYMYESPNGKKYIGQTITTINQRKKDSFGTGYSECTAFWNAICKYGGLENFTLTILKEADNNELDSLEQFYIKLYNTLVPNGYNIQLGGKEKKEQGSCKKVCKYNEKGELIQTYNSVSEAARENMCSASNITGVCQGKVISCHGYRWAYYGELPSSKPFCKKKVYCFNEEGFLLNEFDKAENAAHYYNVPKAWIFSCCNKNMKRKRVLDSLIFTYEPYIDWEAYKLIRHKRSQRSTTIQNGVGSSDPKCYTSLKDEDIV